MQPLFEMQQVKICYDGKPVVRDVSIQLRPGEILGIVGESGSGKSSLIKGAMGLLEGNGAITKGEVYYRGQNLLQLSEEEMRRLRGPSMAMIFQDSQAALCPIRTVGDQLYESVLEHEKIEKGEVFRRTEELFSRMGLEGERILKSYPFELSGGMSQRAGIVMAMILKPDLLFADEPTSALDVTVQAQVVEELLNMRDRYHTAMVVVTHNIGVVERMADQIAVMYQGRVVEYGTREEILRNPREEYTRKLMASVLRLQR